MNCPKCLSDDCRHSQRQGSIDFLPGIAGLRPWRCRECQARFFAWSVATRYVNFAHCGKCGNLDVKRISRDYVVGSFAWLLRILRLPAYRCGPCRNKFFSIRRHLRVMPSPQVPARESAGTPPR